MKAFVGDSLSNSRIPSTSAGESQLNMPSGQLTKCDVVMKSTSLLFEKNHVIKNPRKESIQGMWVPSSVEEYIICVTVLKVRSQSRQSFIRTAVR